jgi:hypothetical protein
MKTKAIVSALTASILLTASSMLADDVPQKQTKTDRRLMKTELKILFEQYKKARTMLANLDLESGLSQAKGTQTAQEQEAIVRQREFLRQEVTDLRTRIHEMGRQAEEMRGPKEKDKAKKKHDS